MSSKYFQGTVTGKPYNTNSFKGYYYLYIALWPAGPTWSMAEERTCHKQFPRKAVPCLHLGRKSKNSTGAYLNEWSITGTDWKRSACTVVAYFECYTSRSAVQNRNTLRESSESVKGKWFWGWRDLLWDVPGWVIIWEGKIIARDVGRESEV